MALISKIWQTFYSFASQSFKLLTTSVWNYKVVPLSLYFKKEWLDWFVECTYFYLKELQWDSATIPGFGSLRVSGNEWCKQIISHVCLTNLHLSHPYQTRNCCLTGGWSYLSCITSSPWNVSLSISMSHLPPIFLTSDIMSLYHRKTPQTWFELLTESPCSLKLLHIHYRWNPFIFKPDEGKWLQRHWTWVHQEWW